MNIVFIWFTKITAWIVQHIAFRTKVYYIDKKKQGRFIKGPAILICNHTSVFDYAVLLFVFYFNTLRVLMAELLFKKPFLGKILKPMGGIYVNRNAYDFSFVGDSERILKKKGIIGIFPEARIPRPEEKRPLEFKPSAAYIALQTGVKIIPCYTNGTYFTLKKRAAVIIGTPIDVAQWYDPSKNRRDNLDVISKNLRQEIINLGKELKKREQRDALRPPFFYWMFDIIKISSAPSMLWFRPKMIYSSPEAKKKYKKGVMFFSNHTGFIDPFVLMMGIWYRRMHFVTLQEIHDNPKMKFWFTTGFRTIPIDRDNMNFNSFKKVADYLDAGCACAIFPEGHIKTNDEPVDAFKNGMVLMAVKGKAPLVPLYVERRKHWWNRQLIFQGAAVDVIEMYGPTPTMAQIEEAGRICRERELELAKMAESMRK